MTIVVSSGHGAALDGSIRARTIDPAPKCEWRRSFRMKDDVLFVDGALEFAGLTRTLVVTTDGAAVLHDLHDLRASPAIWPSGVNRPIAGNIGGRLLRERDAGGEQRQETNPQQQSPYCMAALHGALRRREF